MDLISARDAAKKWGISQRRVAVLCAENRISGAAMLGNMWVIPANAEKPDDERSNRPEKAAKIASPFVKWAGGKTQLLDEIRKKYPEKIERYCEPFVGGGAVLLDVLSNYHPGEVLINDINAELFNTYRQVQTNTDEVIGMLKIMQEEYIPKDDEARKEYYYSKRDRFNDLILQSQNTAEKAALFIFLNRTCFNRLYRVNGKGMFNVPMGAYKNPLICDENNLIKISKLLNNVEIKCGDYKDCGEFIDDRTFVYIDPPYRPLNATSNFTSYTSCEFGDKQQIELAKFVDMIADKGAQVLVYSREDGIKTYGFEA